MRCLVKYKSIIISFLLMLIFVAGLFTIQHRRGVKRVFRSCYGRIEKLFTHDPVHVNVVYAHHLAAGQGYGWKPIENNSTINHHLNKGEFDFVRSCRGFKLNKSSYSEPVLTHQANEMLIEIGKEFDNQTNTRHFFVVTSLTRTLQEQERLREVNGNATRGISSHNYGCSFDISYTRFDGKRGRNINLENLLQGILVEKQKAKQLLIIKEINSTCFHITVPKHKHF